MPLVGKWLLVKFWLFKYVFRSLKCFLGLKFELLVQAKNRNPNLATQSERIKVQLLNLAEFS